MSYRLIFQTGSEYDINDAYYWYESQLKGLGDDFLDEVSSCLHKLKTHPQLFGLTTNDYRKVVPKKFPYILLFKIIEDTVVVYAVFHTSRHPREILKRK